MSEGKKSVSERIKNFVKNHKGLRKVAEIFTVGVVSAAIALSAAACDKTIPKPTPTPGPIVVQQVEVMNILNSNDAFKKMTQEAAQIVFDEMHETVANHYKLTKADVEICDLELDEQNAKLARVVAKVGSNKVVLLSYESEQLGKFAGSDRGQQLVLSEAGYATTAKVEKDKQSQVDAEFTAAVNTILERLSSISEDATLVQANEIFNNCSSVSSIPGFDGKCDGLFVSDVREDGTVVAFTYTKQLSDGTFEFNGYQDHVLKVEGRENMTDAQIMAQIAAGNFTKTTRTIKADQIYVAPALEEKPVVEYVNFDEVYNEIFGEDYALTSPTELFEGVLPNVFDKVQDSRLVMHSITDDALTLFVEFTDKLGRTNFGKAEYKGNNIEDIKLYCDACNDATGGIKAYLKSTYYVDNIQEGSEQEEQLRSNLSQYKTYAESCRNAVTGLTADNFSKSNVMTATEDELDADAFGEKLCPDKEVIATYVGAQSGSINDSTHVFNTGYYSQFKMSVVCLENGNAVVKNCTVYVPYTKGSSTNDSLYNSFLSGEENKNYKIVSRETEIVENATVANQPQAASCQVVREYIIEGLDEESTKIAAAALASYLADLER